MTGLSIEIIEVNNGYIVRPRPDHQGYTVPDTHVAITIAGLLELIDELAKKEQREGLEHEQGS